MDEDIHELVKVLSDIATELHELNKNFANVKKNTANASFSTETPPNEKLIGFQKSGFQTYLTKKGRSGNTVDSYTDRVQRYFDRYPEISVENLSQFEEVLMSYSAKTANLTRAAMGQYFDYIGYAEYQFARAKEQKRTFCDNVLNEEQYNKLIEWAEKNSMQVYKIAKITGSTGVRVSELINLKTADLERGYADITGKGNKTRRIYFPESLVKDILPHCTGTYLIESKIGNQMTTRGIAQHLQKAGERCGLPKEVMHPHSLRHYFAKQFLKQKNDITLLGDLLGHSSISTTAIYTRMTSEEQKKQIDSIVTW